MSYARRYHGDKTYTEDEVKIYLSALADARKICIGTGKGLTASNAITTIIQKLTMQKEVAKMKGKLS